MKRKQIPRCSIYAIIDRQACGQKTLAAIARDCVQAGIKILQLRDKTEDVRAFYRDALLIREITLGKAIFIINDRADIARLVDSDGLHLGQDDIPVKAARKILGRGKIIGKSCHSLRQARQAEKEGADYISIGPVFRTPTKPGYTPVGLRLLKKAHPGIKIPIAAIGGINIHNIKAVKEAGAVNFAVVRAVCRQRNVVKAVSELKKAAHIN